ncbi:MAG: hypothetical protein ACREQY_19460, partial [Candidatus Binatia bacterium]
VSALLSRLWPTLFAFQFFVECRPLPGVASVLDDSEVRWAPSRGPGSDERNDSRRLLTEATSTAKPLRAAREGTAPRRDATGR